MEAFSSLSIEDQMVVGAFYDPQMLLHKNHDDEDHIDHRVLSKTIQYHACRAKRPERIEAIHKNFFSWLINNYGQSWREIEEKLKNIQSEIIGDEVLLLVHTKGFIRKNIYKEF